MVKAIAIPYAAFFALVLYYNTIGNRGNKLARAEAAPPAGDSNSMAHKIQGVWDMGGEIRTIFIIKENKIIYPEIEASYRFYLKRDSMQIEYGDHKDVFSVSMRGMDTLILTNSRRHVYGRFKDG